MKKGSILSVAPDLYLFDNKKVYIDTDDTIIVSYDTYNFSSVTLMGFNYEYFTN
jgi:hypothetical protein